MTSNTQPDPGPAAQPTGCHRCPAAQQLLRAPLLWLQGHRDGWRGWTAGDCVWLKMCGEKGGMGTNSAPKDAAGTHHILPREQRKLQGHRDTKPALPALCPSSLPAVAVCLCPPAIQDATCGDRTPTEHSCQHHPVFPEDITFGRERNKDAALCC